MLLMSQMSAGTIVLIIAYLLAGGYAAYWLYFYVKRRQSATLLKADEFEVNMRQAQIVDVRESNEYRLAHILGARNVPYSTTQQGGGLPGFNKSKPIYLYDNGVAVAGRMAVKLKAAGYSEIYILKGGFSAWKGKTKRRAN